MSAQPAAPLQPSPSTSTEQRPARVIVTPRRIGIVSEVQVTLDEVLASVLANNKDVDSSRIDQRVSALKLMAARGSYDVRLGTEGYWERAISPVSSSLGGGAVSGQLRQITSAATPQLSGLIPHTGGTFAASLASSRTSTDNQFATLNPQFPTTLVVSLTQPLLRGLRYDDTRLQIDVARKNIDISDEQFRQKVIEITTQGVNAYWELVYAVKNFQVQMEAVELARRQVESNQRQVQQDILAPIDVVEAETQFATFEQNVYTAQQALTRAENALKALMLPDRSSLLWAAALVPATPLNLSAPELDLNQAVKEALAGRPELSQVRLSMDVNKANSRSLREQTKPQVDLVAEYRSAGLAGQALPAGPNPLTAGTEGLVTRLNDLSRIAGLAPLPPISLGGSSGPPAFLVGGYGQSLSNLSNFTFPTAHIGLKISLPLRNRTANANLAASVAETRRIENKQQQVEQQIEADVRNTLQAIDSIKARLDAASSARQSSEAQYQSELRKFQEGTSTVFLVLQRQTAMISARSGELRAQTDLSTAIADFERATTRTLAAHNINIETGRKPAANRTP